MTYELLNAIKISGKITITVELILVKSKTVALRVTILAINITTMIFSALYKF